MPELPEVETIANDLDDLTAGCEIIDVKINYPKIVASSLEQFPSLLKNSKIVKVKRFAKWIRFFLEKDQDALNLLVHLKMTGQFLMGPWPDDNIWPKHVHAAFLLSATKSGEKNLGLFYCDIRKFGRLRAFTEAETESFLQTLGQGPDPFQLSASKFHDLISPKKGRLKAVLLDQRIVSGLGNIYVDEGLFAAGLSPLRAASSLNLEESEKLFKELKRILTASIKLRGSTTSNYQGLKGKGGFQAEHKVYGRAGVKCPKCAHIIERMVLGGRSTHICPRCQRFK